MTSKCDFDIENIIDEVNDLENAIDPIGTPYESKYEAVNILLDTNKRLKQLVETNKGETWIPKCLWRIGYINYRLAVLHYKTEENQKCFQCLQEALFLLTQNQCNYRMPESLIDTYNHLGLVYFERDDPNSSLESLHNAESIYKTYRDNNPLISLNIDEMNEKDQNIEKLHTSTNFYLAQVYGHIDNMAKSAMYCQKTLKRQYETNNYNPLEFSTFCMQIVDYYISTQNFDQALYCISASETIFKTISNADEEVLAQLSADISLRWGNLILSYLSYQKDIYNNETNPTVSKKSALIEFNGLKLEPSPIQFKSISSYADAESFLNQGLHFFKKAKEYYILDGFVTEHFEILQSISKLYDIVSSFTKDHIVRIGLHEERIHLLEPLLTVLNPNHFHVMIQQIYVSCGEIYEEMMSILYEQYKNYKTFHILTIPPNDDIRNMNHYISRSIFMYEKFIQSIIKIQEEKKNPLEIDEDYREPFFNILFALTSLYQKIMSNNKKLIIESYEKSISYCEMILKYSKFSSTSESIQKNIRACNEMMKLLDETIINLKES